jgi:hypothetical protein
MKIINKMSESNIDYYQYFIAKNQEGKKFRDTIYFLSNSYDLMEYVGFVDNKKNKMSSFEWIISRPEELKKGLFLIEQGKNKGFYKKNGGTIYKYVGFRRVNDKVYSLMEEKYIQFERLTKENEKDWAGIYAELDYMNRLNKAFFPEAPIKKKKI